METLRIASPVVITETLDSANCRYFHFGDSSFFSTVFDSHRVQLLFDSHRVELVETSNLIHRMVAFAKTTLIIQTLHDALHMCSADCLQKFILLCALWEWFFTVCLEHLCALSLTHLILCIKMVILFSLP